MGMDKIIIIIIKKRKIYLYITSCMGPIVLQLEGKLRSALSGQNFFLRDEYLIESILIIYLSL